MKIFKINLMIMALLLAACSYPALSPPTATVQVLPIVPPSGDVTSSPLPLLLPTETPTREPVVTDTLQPSDTPQPTFTPTTGLIMEIVSDGVQPPVSQPTAQAQACGRPSNWAAYTVQRGDTLSSLAQRTGTSTQQIQTANCLAGTLIFAGQVLYLPFVPAPQAGGSTPGSPGGNSPSTEPTATIRTPKVGLPGDHPVNISPSSGPPGTKFTLSVDQYSSNEKVIITVISVNTNLPILEQTLYTDDDGNLTWFFKSPANMAEGDYNVFEDGIQSGAAGKGHFSITSPPASTSP